jgi:asparagine synthase (glutamine-hydrolysing)
MCGLTGLYAFSPVGYFYSINVNKALATLAHRGPDSFGYYSEDMFTLGHRRLSVIDTSPAARQPMKSADGRYVIAFNGELFNYRSLRNLMEAKGVQFQTESDTEVLPYYFVNFYLLIDDLCSN